MTTRKRLRNVPILHDEVKTKITVILTPTAWSKIKFVSRLQVISASELIEGWARSLDGNSHLPVSDFIPDLKDRGFHPPALFCES